MNYRSEHGLATPGAALLALERELVGVEDFLHKLRHNRGRWPRVWVNGMLRHYDDRRAKLRDAISRKKARPRRRKT